MSTLNTAAADAQRHHSLSSPWMRRFLWVGILLSCRAEPVHVVLAAHAVMTVAAHRANGGCWSTNCSKGWHCNRESGFCQEDGSGTGPSSTAAAPRRLPRTPSRAMALGPAHIEGDTGSSLTMLSLLWREVAQSTNEKEEKLAIEQIRQVLAEGQATVTVYERRSDGTEFRLPSTERLLVGEALNIVFTEEGRRRSFLWSPVDVQNAHFLLKP